MRENAPQRTTRKEGKERKELRVPEKVRRERKTQGQHQRVPSNRGPVKLAEGRRGRIAPCLQHRRNKQRPHKLHGLWAGVSCHLQGACQAQAEWRGTQPRCRPGQARLQARALTEKRVCHAVSGVALLQLPRHRERAAAAVKLLQQVRERPGPACRLSKGGGLYSTSGRQAGRHAGTCKHLPARAAAPRTPCSCTRAPLMPRIWAM